MAQGKGSGEQPAVRAHDLTLCRFYTPQGGERQRTRAAGTGWRDCADGKRDIPKTRLDHALWNVASEPSGDLTGDARAEVGERFLGDKGCV
jgi:hypothetical protein